ncbi:hypothetical protein X805_34840 [Sphaerotilus natans subsp. natans DSM 6575]|uniref:Porin domain-containing protein n=1 Tax=Sphaerotilus natans subsp. natans DSM 6575 TaxID=1286631 RepID=A0A059KIQ6_9BURK|nr:porin [Sphaerotilus natans]KDB50978.1 hypothetical protein X805_34840 [Sphaerotilus natans subsp. natans DSM 6575]SIR06002.1 Outer membrane protein (porin) [Sphaerotilus natans]
MTLFVRPTARLTLLALPLALTAALPALAQSANSGSNVTVYGRVDLGAGRYAQDIKSSEDTKAMVQDSSTARLGFRGTEDLGGGLSAFFNLEHRFKADTGVQDGVMWKDKAFVGIGHKQFGSITLGRISSPGDNNGIAGRYEAFGGDSLASNGSRGAKLVAKWDNTVYYQAPRWSGFSFGAAVSEASATQRKRVSGIQADYIQGPVLASVTYQTDASATDDWKTLALAGTYDFKVVKLMGIWAKSSDLNVANNGEQTVLTLGAQIPAGPGQVRVSWQKRDDNAALGSAAERRLGLGYHYPLSKQVSLNLSLAHHGYRKGTVDNGVMQYETAVRYNF